MHGTRWFLLSFKLAINSDSIHFAYLNFLLLVLLLFSQSYAYYKIFNRSMHAFYILLAVYVRAHCIRPMDFDVFDFELHTIIPVLSYSRQRRTVVRCVCCWRLPAPHHLPIRSIVLGLLFIAAQLWPGQCALPVPPIISSHFRETRFAFPIITLRLTCNVQSKSSPLHPICCCRCRCSYCCPPLLWLRLPLHLLAGALSLSLPIARPLDTYGKWWSFLSSQFDIDK